MKNVKADLVAVDAENVNDVAALAEKVLRSGELIVMPTETVYGVAAHPDIADGLARLYAAKSRDPDKPIAFLAADMESIRAFGAEISPDAEVLARSFWPGPLTLVLPVHDNGNEGFRVPNHSIALAILRRCGGLLRVSSANASGCPAALTAKTALAALATHVTVGFDAGPASGGVASTVVRADSTGVMVLREGAIGKDQIEHALQSTQPLGNTAP